MRQPRLVTAVLFVLVTLIALIAPSASAAPRSHPWLGWGASSVSATRVTENALGMAPAALSTYAPFDQPFPVEWAAAARQRSVPLVVAWEPWDWHQPNGSQPSFALARIAAGEFDSYAHEFARAVRDSGAMVLLRFAPEMNGNWGSPWGAQFNRPEEFVAAWRHLHDIFTAEGVTNVKWVFNPNVRYWGAPYPLTAYWPGADVVDWVALDGYNWADILPGWKPQTFSDVFGPSITELRTVAPNLPLMVAETAAAPSQKEAYIRSMIRQAPTLGVNLVVWFEHDKETDWRLAASPMARQVKPLMRANGWHVRPATR